MSYISFWEQHQNIARLTIEAAAAEDAEAAMAGEDPEEWGTTAKVAPEANFSRS